MRCLLVEHPDGLVLIDTALGPKEDAKFKGIYGIENEAVPLHDEAMVRANVIDEIA